ncbi:hypothetical protein C8Q79DRAFT_997802 [Trametes meyenii]|nr:hypothetical protein C8Q79DRAFT_997802 [Trametes meyenii]
MSKSTVEYTGRRITYETPLSFTEVIARLEKELNKPAGGQSVFRILGMSKSKTELETGINELLDGHNFIYFASISHHNWLGTYTGSPGSVPQAVVYTFGNPLLAQAMLQHDLAVGLHVPPKLLVLENADRRGTRVIYDDPAALIPVPSPATAAGEGVNAELRTTAEELSAKVEELVKAITA